MVNLREFFIVKRSIPEKSFCQQTFNKDVTVWIGNIRDATKFASYDEAKAAIKAIIKYDDVIEIDKFYSV